MNTPENGDIFSGKKHWGLLDNREDKISDWRGSNGSFKVDRITRPLLNGHYWNPSNGGGKLLFERKETPEYTLEELIEKVGHEFKIKK